MMATVSLWRALTPDQQHGCATLARLGTVVFSYDMIRFGDSGHLG